MKIAEIQEDTSPSEKRKEYLYSGTRLSGT